MARRAKGEGTIRKRKDNRWEGWFNIGKDENGKIQRISVTAKTKTTKKRKYPANYELTFPSIHFFSFSLGITMRLPNFIAGNVLSFLISLYRLTGEIESTSAACSTDKVTGISSKLVNIKSLLFSCKTLLSCSV